MTSDRSLKIVSALPSPGDHADRAIEKETKLDDFFSKNEKERGSGRAGNKLDEEVTKEEEIEKGDCGPPT